jgi:Glyoxalase-like domain
MADYLRLRQICLVAPALEPSVRFCEQVLGLAVCHRDPNVAAYGLENVLFPIGTSFLEIVAPIRPDTTAGRFLERSQGRGAYMVIFDCSDLPRRAAHAQSLGIRIASSHSHDGYHGVQLHPKDCRAAMLELDHTDGGDDPMAVYGPAGGTGWTHAIRSGPTRALTAIRVESPEPDDLAGHWARILELPVAARQLATAPTTIAFAAATSGAPDAPAAREAVTRLTLDVRDPVNMRDAARAHGQPFDGDMPVLCGVALELLAGPRS